MDIISKEQAEKAGLKRYYTGERCKNGHLSDRFVTDGKCGECVKEKNRASYARNRKKRLDTIKAYHNNNQDNIKEYQREYVLKNREKDLTEWRRRRSSAQRNYLEGNVERRCKINEYVRNKYENDELFRISCVIRQFLHRTLRSTGDRKTNTTFKVIGYTSSELICHIESLFSEGMSWDNYGEWHIDHVVPLSKMVSNGERDPSVINALSNLKPMWAFDNQSKGNRFIG